MQFWGKTFTEAFHRHMYYWWHYTVLYSKEVTFQIPKDSEGFEEPRDVFHKFFVDIVKTLTWCKGIFSIEQNYISFYFTLPEML